MSKLGTAAFKGASGHTFEFGIYPMDAKMKAGHGGVYVVTARREDEHGHHKHHKIFIGQTDDLSTVLQGHPKASVFDTEGANCICIHPTQDDKARTHIIDELAQTGIPSA